MPTPLITLALSKGRIFDETLPLLKAAGIEVLDDPDTTRKLILATNQPDQAGDSQQKPIFFHETIELGKF